MAGVAPVGACLSNFDSIRCMNKCYALTFYGVGRIVCLFAPFFIMLELARDSFNVVNGMQIEHVL